MNKLSRPIIAIISTLFLITVIWEDTASRVPGNIIKPSYCINYLAVILQVQFEHLGRIAAFVSSFLVHLHLEKLFTSFVTILNAVLGLMTSCFYFFNGYFDEIRLYYASSSNMIYWGSIIISLVISAVVGWYFNIHNFVYSKVQEIKKAAREENERFVKEQSENIVRDQTERIRDENAEYFGEKNGFRSNNYSRGELNY